MSRHELVLFLSVGTTPERPARTDRRALPFGDIGGRGMGSEDVAVVGPPADKEDGAAEGETDEGYEDPVASHLRKKVSVILVMLFKDAETGLPRK